MKRPPRVHCIQRKKKNLHYWLIKVVAVCSHTLLPLLSQRLDIVAEEVWSLGCEEILNCMLHRLIITEGLPFQEVIEMSEKVVVSGRGIGEFGR